MGATKSTLNRSESTKSPSPPGPGATASFTLGASDKWNVIADAVIASGSPIPDLPSGFLLLVLPLASVYFSFKARSPSEETKKSRSGAGMSRRFLRGRLARRVLPPAVVLVVVAAAVSGMLASAGSGQGGFYFGVYWPEPSSYLPGSVPPTAYLQINYTGPGNGAYTYVVYSNSTGADAIMGQGTAVLQSGASFRDFVSVNVTGNGGVLLGVDVFSGPKASGALVYTKSLVF